MLLNDLSNRVFIPYIFSLVLLCTQILGTGFLVIFLNLGKRKPGDARYLRSDDNYAFSI